MKKKIYQILLLLAVSVQAWGQSYDYQRGDEAYYNGEFEEAVKYYAKDIDANPSHIEAYTSIAACCRELGRLEKGLDALEYAKPYCKSKQALRAYYNMKADLLEVAGDTAAAIDFYSKAVKAYPKDVNSLNSLGWLYMQKGQYAEAENYYKKCVALDKDNANQSACLARLYNKQKRWNDALKCVAGIDSTDTVSYGSLAIRAESYYHLKQYDKMAADLTQSFSIEALNDRAYDFLTDLDSHQALRATLAPFKVAMSKNSKEKMWPFLIGVVYEQLDSMSQSNDYFLKALDLDENPGFRYRIAMNLYNLGFTDLALDEIKRGLELDSTYYVYYSLKSKILRSEGRYKEAIEAANALVKGVPDDYYSYYQRAIGYYKDGDYDAALEEFNTSIDLNYDWAWMYYMRGKNYQKKGNYSKALADFQKVLDLSPAMGKSADTTDMMFSNYYLGRKAEAERWADSVKVKDDMFGFYDLACFYSLEGKTDASLSALKTAFEKGYRRFWVIEHDDNLANINKLPQFATMLSEYKQKFQKEESDYRASHNLPAKVVKSTATAVKKTAKTKTK